MGLKNEASISNIYPPVPTSSKFGDYSSKDVVTIEKMVSSHLKISSPSRLAPYAKSGHKCLAVITAGKKSRSEILMCNGH